MIRTFLASLSVAEGIPRESGDDPCSASMVSHVTGYSPRERG